MLGISAGEFQIHRLNSSITFDHVGQMSVGVSYAHIVHDIHFNTLLQTGTNLANALTNITSKFIFRFESNRTRNIVLQRSSRALQVLRRAIGRVEKSAGLFLTPEEIGRYERQAFALGLGFFTSVFSIFEEVQIQRINAQVSNLQKNQRMIVAKVELLDKAVSTNSENIDILKSAAAAIIAKINKDEIKQQWDEIITAIESAVNDYSLTSDLMETASVTLFHGQLHPEIFKMDKVDEALFNLTSELNVKGFRPVALNRDSFLRSKISWMSNGEVLRVFIHIPITPMKNYDLYRLIPTPTSLANNTVSFFEDPKGNMLAVNPANNMNIVIRENELDACRRIGNNYACDDRRVVRTTMESCLAMAHLGKINGVLDRCSSVIAYTESIHLIEYSEDSQVLVTLNDAQLTISCTGDKPKMIHLTRGTWFVSSTCQYTIGSYAFTPLTDFPVKTPDFFEVPAAINISDIILMAHDMDPSEMDEYAKKLASMKGPAPRHMEDLKRLTWIKNDGHLLAVFSAIAVVCVLAGGLGFCFCLRRCACCRRLLLGTPSIGTAFVDQTIPKVGPPAIDYSPPTSAPHRMAPAPPAPPPSLARSRSFSGSARSIPSIRSSNRSLPGILRSSSAMSDRSMYSFRPARQPTMETRRSPVNPLF